MKTIILPGYSPHNKDWAEEMKKRMKLGHNVFIHEWKHWGDKGSLSLAYETTKILEEIGKEKVNFLAKSVGTRVAANIIPRISEQINKVIFCGIPTTGKSEETKKLYAFGLSCISPGDIIVFQNSKDPLANYSEVKKFINSLSPLVKVIEMPCPDHNYPYPEEFENFLK